MLDRLVDNSWLLYALLAAAGTTLLVLWYNTPRKSYLAGVGGVSVLAAVVALLGLLIETDFARIKRSVEVMAAGARTQDLDTIFSHISDRYKTPGGRTKDEFRQFAGRVLDRHEVTEVAVWGFETDKPIGRADATATVSFQVKVKGDMGERFFRCEATFERESDGAWRVVRTKFFDPLSTNEIHPGF